MNLMLNGKENGWRSGKEEYKAPIEQQLMEYVRSMKEEGQRGETKEAYASRVYAKARSGQRLTPDEMNFLARTNPELYRKVLRAQMMRRELENRLKNCRSKKEAQEVFAAAVESISEKDPDRDMIIQALNQAFREFKESGAYQELPGEEEEGKEGQAGRKKVELSLNGSGYQELYIAEEKEVFEAGA